MQRKSTSSSRRKIVRTEIPLRAASSIGGARPRYSAESSYHWIFRSNIPKRRSLVYLPNDIQKRNFFGIGEVVGVLTNPSQTLRSLTEAKNLLEQTRNELTEARERAQITPTHTFSPLPDTIFFPRKAEVRAIENILNGEPTWTVLFGASSTGKTAILRNVLSKPRYHVLHFDLRIAGFADLASLYTSLNLQMEQYFQSISETLEGYGEFETEAWAFKHDRLNVERRLIGAEARPGESMSTFHGVGDVKTSDIARLMEMFQSSLLKYRQFEPCPDEDEDDRSDMTHTTHVSASGSEKKSRAFWKRSRDNGKERASQEPTQEQHNEKPTESRERLVPVEKPVPVIFFDEAHKLPALIHSTGAMKCLLDAMLVLTKQDRLCHVIHATSEPFYQTWLRRANVMQHCKVITIGDCSKSDMRLFFRERIMPFVPEKLRGGLIFHQLYDAFGGKLAHWQDYVTDYVNANGKLDIKQSSHFLQAHALLNLHILHSVESPPPETANRNSNQTGSASAPNLHGSGGGFKIYSPLTVGLEGEDEAASADFTATQLIKVMNKLTETENGVRSLPYFALCREIGVKAVDGMVRGRILDLRWSDVVRRSSVPAEEKEEVHASKASVFRERGGAASVQSEGEEVQREEEEEQEDDENDHFRAASSGTMVNDRDAVFDAEEGEIVPATSDTGLSPVDVIPVHDHMDDDDAPDDDFVGPKLLPATPIMRFAMREVVADYYVEEAVEDDSVSEYASLSDPDEY